MSEVNANINRISLSYPTRAPIVALKLKLGVLTLFFLFKAKLQLSIGALERAASFKHDTLLSLTLFLLANLLWNCRTRDNRHYIKLKFKEPSTERGNEIQSGCLTKSLKIMKTKSVQTNNLDKKGLCETPPFPLDSMNVEKPRFWPKP